MICAICKSKNKQQFIHVQNRKILYFLTNCLSDRLCVVKCSPSAPAGLHVNRLGKKKKHLFNKSYSFLYRITNELHSRKLTEPDNTSNQTRS